MPYRVTKGKNNFLIQKNEKGIWKTIGHSDSEEKAKASVRARYAAEENPTFGK